MSNPDLGLPQSPSIQQLRKKAKELLKEVRTGDPTALERFSRAFPDRQSKTAGAFRLADAQFVVARDHGFSSWARLVHHIENVTGSRIANLEWLARSLVAAWHGDPTALNQLNNVMSKSLSLDRLRTLVSDRLPDIPPRSFEMTDAQRIVAGHLGFGSWEELAVAAEERGNGPNVSHGLSSASPFFKFDEQSGTIEPLQPLSAKDWDVVIGYMKEQGIFKLNAAGQMTDSAFRKLTTLSGMTHLNLDGCKRLTDDGMRHLAAFTELESLNLSGWHNRFGDRGLHSLRQLKKLRVFEMYWGQRVTDAGLAHLEACDELERVDLLGSMTGNGAIKTLGGKSRLRQLKTGRLVTDEGISHLHDIPVFKEWQGGERRYELMSADCRPNHVLLDGPITNKGLAAVRGLNGVFGLSFFWHLGPDLTGPGLQALTDLPNLGFLGCEGGLCDDTAMRHIGEIPSLRMLMGQGAVATDLGFKSLSQSKSIEYFWGRKCPNLKGAGFAALASMPALRGLAVSCKGVDDKSLALLPTFPSLTDLMPMDVTDRGFAHVGRCERLTGLWCMYCRETGDEATSQIAGLTNLRTYYAGKTKITDQSLKMLARMESLEHLTFWECSRITNEGVSTLARLPRLRELHLQGLGRVTRTVLSLFPERVRVYYE